MDNKLLFETISTDASQEIVGGKSANCRWAAITCAHDIALAGLGTSDPASSCAYMRRVCS